MTPQSLSSSSGNVVSVEAAWQVVLAHRQALEVERDRYREALERIAAWKGSDYYGDKCARIAREALDA